MSGPKPAYPIALRPEEEAHLRRIANARTAPQGHVVRARILLAAHDHPQWSNQQVAREVGCTARTVRKWRKRWVETHSIEDRPRSSAPRAQRGRTESPSGPTSS